MPERVFGFWNPGWPAAGRATFRRLFRSPAIRRLVRERPVFLSDGTRRLIDGAVFVGILAVLLSYFRPGLLLSITTTTGGDTGAHFYVPWYLKTHLLPKGQITGWSPGWYGGFPILQFYFPLVATVQAVLGYVIPYEVAFKLGTVLGSFFLPVAAYSMCRLLRLNWPVPIAAAILSMGFLFMESFTIYGGNIASSLAGEYSFGLSLGLSLIFLGLAYRLATEKRATPLRAAVVLALAVLSHLLPVAMVILITPLFVIWAVQKHGRRNAFLRFGTVYGLAFMLTAFWSLPFLARLRFTTDMRWIPLEGWAPLVPRDIWVPMGGMGLAFVLAAFRQDRRPLIFLLLAVLGSAIYFFLPPGSVWNGRFLPFVYLSAFFSTAYLVGTTLPSAAIFLYRRRAGATAAALVGAIAVTVLVPMIRGKERRFVDNWIKDNYSGYESRADFPTFKALNDRLRRLAPGRVLWEPSPQLGKFGTPVALMTIPYWSGQPTMEGINFESSMTTPFHFMMVSELADQPSNPIPGLPYHDLDIRRGRLHMQVLDVRYYVSFSQRARSAAQAAGLKRLEDVGEFSIFAVDSPGQVVVPKYEPVVLEADDWVNNNIKWFSKVGRLDQPLVREGPREWARVKSADQAMPRRELPSGGRSIPAKQSDDEISFTTDAVGQPHWIKTSYFPNWKVEGARGPYLASPSTQIVIPTQRRVRLSYTRTWPEWSGMGLTLLALGALWIAPSRRYLRNLGSAREFARSSAPNQGAETLVA